MHFLPELIDNYVVNHSQQEPKILQELSKETWQKVLNPRMLSGAFQGRVLSMISKLIVVAQTRDEAILKMKRALDEYIIEGIKTTIPFHQKLMQNEDFCKGNFTTKFMETFEF